MGFDFDILLQAEHSALILVMSLVRPGQYTVSAALAFILSTPWWAAWRSARIAGRRSSGMTSLSPNMSTPSNSYSECLRGKNGRMFCARGLASSGNPSLNV